MSISEKLKPTDLGWGNSETYRKFFSDYQEFLRRSQESCQKTISKIQPSDSCYLVKTDITGFFDCIDRIELFNKLIYIANGNPEDNFWILVKQAMQWKWDNESHELGLLFRDGKLPSNGIPQGLVASGWLANIYLHKFDSDISATLSESNSPSPNFRPVDYMRYVDDIAVVIHVSGHTDNTLEMFRELFGADTDNILKSQVVQWLTSVLKDKNLIFDKEKTKFFPAKEIISKDETSTLMERIQLMVSGPFDRSDSQAVLMNSQILLDSIEGTAKEGHWKAWVEKNSQTIAGKTPIDIESLLFPIEASSKRIKDATIARFSANRVARTISEVNQWSNSGLEYSSQNRHFFRSFVSIFMNNPSLSIVLRRAFELDPDSILLAKIIHMTQHVLTLQNSSIFDKYVMWYFISDLLRAGSREIGFNQKDISIEKLEIFRSQLDQLVDWLDTAQNVICPWYVVRQILLYRSFRGHMWPYTPVHKNYEFSKDYLGVFSWISFTGNYQDLDPKSLNLAIDWFGAERIPPSRISGFLSNISDKILAHNIFYSLYYAHPDIAVNVSSCIVPEGDHAPYWISKNLHRNLIAINQDGRNISQRPMPLSVISIHKDNPFQHEACLLSLAEILLSDINYLNRDIDPWMILVSLNNDGTYVEMMRNEKQSLQLRLDDKIYDRIDIDPRFKLPSWVPEDRSIGYRLGMLLRSACLGAIDYTGRFIIPKLERSHDDALHRYRGHRGTWERRQFGLFGDPTALVGEKSTVSTWIQDFLAKLLAWPGSHFWGIKYDDKTILNCGQLLKVVSDRKKILVNSYARNINTPVLIEPLNIDLLKPPLLRIVIIQNVRPVFKDFIKYKSDLNDKIIRKEHRLHIQEIFSLTCKHLSASTTISSSHTPFSDLILLPEVAIHEDDLDLVEALSRKTHASILTGLVFRKNSNGNLINQAAWYLRDTSYSDIGQSIRNRYCFQGKNWMNEYERSVDIKPSRDTQQIIECRHPSLQVPVRITASICFDATDVGLAADLRNITDMFIVPSFNKDVNNFDAMAASYRYQMFQHVAIINTGEFGGTSVSSPQGEENRHQRILSHVHGGGHIAISLCEVDLTEYHRMANPQNSVSLKSPPAGYNRYPTQTNISG